MRSRRHGLAQERHTLGIGAAGPSATAWTGADRVADFFTIKGVVETLLAALNVTDYRFVPGAIPHFTPGAALCWKWASPTRNPRARQERQMRPMG